LLPDDKRTSDHLHAVFDLDLVVAGEELEVVEEDGEDAVR
jgi:hypothetical protein